MTKAQEKINIGKCCDELRFVGGDQCCCRDSGGKLIKGVHTEFEASGGWGYAHVTYIGADPCCIAS